MRIKSIISVFPRKLPSGKRVYYYQCYDQQGNRQWAKSTGLSKKTEAVAFCMGLHKSGLLIPQPKMPTFAEFSIGWWEADTCRYLKWRMLHDPITTGTLVSHQGHFKNHIKEHFAKYKLDEITPVVIENWLVSMSEKKLMKNMREENKTMLKPKTINHALSTLRVMMGEAARQKLIKENPCLAVKELKEDYVEREILTVEEVKKMFPPDWKTVWKKSVFYKANLLAACTGLRIGELRGLRGEYVFDEYIYICGQYTRYGYSPITKTKENRNIPIASMMREELEELIQLNGEGYIFSEDGGKTPVKEDRLRRHFERALRKIGIDEAERIKRNLTFHGWRHFLNTLLRMSNVSDSKVQSVTGHKTKKMTDHYTHFDTKQFTEVRDVQTNLLTFNKPKEAEIINITDAEIVKVVTAKAKTVKTTSKKTKTATAKTMKPKPKQAKTAKTKTAKPKTKKAKK